ncbi:hypothetical protein P5V78_12010 [Mycobacteroides abscessus subsp. abscessus]|uniref:hypothetical protein n=1 Tax=Mycobacteroides abscessus TaxID=36809 RepID=UPI000683291C|nr:hypothetical protein [Mycobacteroides abscessus]QPO17516.1 hypothetical protein PHIGD23-1_57 [Mycobacterium phage phiGD23-1]QPO17636.1 hypothetical protein PHIGD22-1_57 [Mycobacterium phage phiGD22-1]QPO17818.1 hypothetical protein PROPHIGD20-1_55 [Mycobacterium phage phiGD20-1]QSM02078.1 hypothetical protein PROPHIGD20-1_23 [Mycobacterium phage prophiGD20-1]QSM02551.1 hypothetical protein PROPHIGD57-2_23 [Mycobacterium phage prophiGD57-2]QSM03027.1 hypothetical protein PROPHIGD22-1_24 [My
MSIQIASIVLLNLLVLWLLIEKRDLRSENTELRREIARLSKHPSTYEPERLPYMRRYADDED